MTGLDICTRAAGCSGLKYWYGGKGELATIALAKTLKTQNPSVWTDSYYAKAILDCDGVTHVGDCSYLVCHAYNIGQINSTSINNRYSKYLAGDPKDGMILWRSGHVGIFQDGRVHELKGIDYDYQYNPYTASAWTNILYDPSIDYDSTPYDYDTGWHWDGIGWWYAYGNVIGSYYKSEWQVIDNHWFHFNADGYIDTGIFTVDGYTYYGTDDGLWHEDPAGTGALKLWEVDNG